jgi:hypothetical protein
MEDFCILHVYLVYFTAKRYTLRPNGILYGQMVYFTAKWYTLRPNGILYSHLVHFEDNWNIFPVLVCCAEKNLATLAHTCQKHIWFRIH